MQEQEKAQREQVAATWDAIGQGFGVEIPERGWWNPLGPVRQPPRFVALAVYGVMAFLLVCAAVIFVFLFWPVFWNAGDAFHHADDFNKILLALAGLIGAPFFVWRVLIAARTNHIAQENLYTTLLTKAVEQLGATREEKTMKDGVAQSTSVPNVEVRLGGLYALEKLAQDYLPLHGPIMEILCAYIRENAGPARPAPDAVRAAYAVPYLERSAEEKTTIADHERDNLRPPSVHVQTALTIIGRRSLAQRAREKELSEAPGANEDAYRLNLSSCHLAGANLRHLHFERCNFNAASLEGAQLYEAHLEGAWLDGAHLEGAQLDGAHLEGAWLNGAHLEGAQLGWAHLEGARLYEAHLEGAWLDGAHLEGARLKGAHLEGARLKGAHLEGARLKGAHLEGARLKGAHLEGAWLVEADLARTSGLEPASFAKAFGGAKTVLPAGMARPTGETWLPEGASREQAQAHWQLFNLRRNELMQRLKAEKTSQAKSS